MSALRPDWCRLPRLTNPRTTSTSNRLAISTSTKPEDIQDIDGHLRAHSVARSDALRRLSEGIPAVRPVLFESAAAPVTRGLKLPLADVKIRYPLFTRECVRFQQQAQDSL